MADISVTVEKFKSLQQKAKTHEASITELRVKQTMAQQELQQIFTQYSVSNLEELRQVRDKKVQEVESVSVQLEKYIAAAEAVLSQLDAES